MAATHCTGCGRPLVASVDVPGAPPGHTGQDRCPGCARPIDPPRYCPACGRWLAVAVSPTGWRARCRDHGDIGPDGPTA